MQRLVRCGGLVALKLKNLVIRAKRKNAGFTPLSHYRDGLYFLGPPRRLAARFDEGSGADPGGDGLFEISVCPKLNLLHGVSVPKLDLSQHALAGASALFRDRCTKSEVLSAV